MSEQAALQKVFNVLGEARGRQVVDQVFEQLGTRELATPNDRVRFGNALIMRGGVLESIGRAIKIQAFLHGATED